MDKSVLGNFKHSAAAVSLQTWMSIMWSNKSSHNISASNADARINGSASDNRNFTDHCHNNSIVNIYCSDCSNTHNDLTYANNNYTDDIADANGNNSNNLADAYSRARNNSSSAVLQMLLLVFMYEFFLLVSMHVQRQQLFLLTFHNKL